MHDVNFKHPCWDLVWKADGKNLDSSEKGQGATGIDVFTVGI